MPGNVPVAAASASYVSTFAVPGAFLLTPGCRSHTSGLFCAALSPQASEVPILGEPNMACAAVVAHAFRQQKPRCGTWGTDSLLCPAASNETLCQSATKLTGTTTVWAKPGLEQKLVNMAATMPGTSDA